MVNIHSKDEDSVFWVLLCVCVCLLCIACCMTIDFLFNFVGIKATEMCNTMCDMTL